MDGAAAAGALAAAGIGGSALFAAWAGAGIGAASGALGGAGIGAMTSSNAQLTIQQQYDNAYAQCMYTRGNAVPGYGYGYGAPLVQSPYAPAYSPGLVRSVQMELNRLGYTRSPPDGVVGPQTATAISQYQRASGMPADGMPSPALLERLQATP